MNSHSFSAVSLLVLASFAAVSAGCSDDEGSTSGTSTGTPGGLQPPTVPEELAVPEGNEVFLKGAASGAQIYVCQEGMDNDYAWALKEPDAELVDDKGIVIATHYAGPTWASSDGSKVVGLLMAKADSPDPDAIPWLLLEAGPTEGDGVFSKVTYIHRVNTAGGKAPESECDNSDEGDESAILYTADYYFYKAK